MGADTMEAMRVCGIVDVAERTGVELCPFEHVEFDMYKIDRPISFNEFPGAAAGAGRGLLHRPAEDEGSRAHHLHGRHEAPVRQPAELRLDGALPSRRHLSEDREPDARRESNMVRDGLALRVPGQRPVQPVQRGPHQGLQHDLRRPRSGCRRHHLRSADGLGLSRHQRALHRAGSGGGLGHEPHGRDRTGRRADRQSQAALQAPEHDPAGAVSRT